MKEGSKTAAGAAGKDAVPVLLVDDLWTNLYAMQCLLAQEPGLELVLAQSGDEALRHAARQDFAVVLLDAQMPDLNGFDTAVLMRGSRRTRDIPIIFVSAAWTTPAQIFKGYESGAIDYITKPFEPEILKSKVRIFADLYRQRRRAEEAIREAEDTERTNEAMTRFLAQMGDELRTPMNTVATFSALLRATRQDEAQAKLVEGICQGCETLLATINDILDASKVQTDGSPELRESGSTP
jgi:DNA-binding response OmpR family regulator